MNNERRKVLKSIKTSLEELSQKLDDVMNDEQIAFDNLTEGLQATARGAAMEEAIDNISSAIDCIDEAIEYIEEAEI